GATDERPEVGPPERRPYADVARQVAGIVRHVDRPAQLVGRRGEQLCQERYAAKTRRIPLRSGEPEEQQPAEGKHREDRNHQVGESALRKMDLVVADRGEARSDRKSTRLNSSHVAISYAVFCLKKKKKEK